MPTRRSATSPAVRGGDGTHDRETLGLLYVDDVRVGGGLTGRDALRDAYFGAALDRCPSASCMPART